jgi:stage II sporulation protein D
MPKDQPATLGSNGPFEILDSRGLPVLEGDSLPNDTPLRMSDGELTLGTKTLGPPALEVRPLGGATLTFRGRQYRSLLRIEASEYGQPQVINRLNIEDYLKGVLPVEMPDRFGLEALKSQAVAARSYALSEGARRGWLHPDVRSQVYGGKEVETWLSTEAVKQTEGQVLAHAGQIIPAWFQSTCGGKTARAADVFPSPPDGVLHRQVPCSDCQHSDTWRWTRTLDAAVVCEAAGLPAAPLESVTLEPPYFPGRPEWITVAAGGLQARLPAVNFRERVSRGQPRAKQLLSTRWAAPPQVSPQALVVEGQGWGHGVGLCQYGANGYARRGAGYRVILRRYYPGADLVQLL